MKLIVRFVQSKGAGRETHEFSFVGDRASIGRGTDQSIQISDRRIPLEHSELSMRRDTLELKSAGRYSFAVNDQDVTRRAELKDGDSVDLMGHDLRILPGFDDADYVIEVELQSESIEPLRNRFRTRLWELGFPYRKISWALFSIVLLIAVVIPSSGFLLGMNVIRSVPVLDDDIWLAGELHDTHAFIGDDCGVCHAIPFVPARDEECLNCHLSVRHHFDTDLLGRDYRIGSECQDCHREHNGDQAIVRTDQGTCTVCHADLARLGFESDRLRPATDFLEDHPSFMVSMYQMQEDETWEQVRMELWDEDLWEESNLKFPHDLHVDPEGVNGPDGVEKLACQDCHEIEKGGLRMKPVTMERHCADCHQLTFDAASPERVVPHGDPEALMELLHGYYAYQFIERESGDAVPAELETLPQRREVRRPGRSRERRDISEFVANASASEPLTEQANQYIDAQVAEAASNLFERQTCTICHEITEQDGEVPWKIMPVKLTPDWYPLAEFSHGSHKNMQCVGCHDAEWSAEAGEVLMPDIGSCRACHGGEHAQGRLQSTCIACHKFHLDNEGPMGELVMIDAEGNMRDMDGNLIDEKGNLIDEEGNLIDEDGNLIDEDGNLVDEEGNLIDEEGNLLEREVESVEPEEPSDEEAAARGNA